MAREGIGPGGIAWRVAAAVLLVLVSFNPGGRSYLHWVAQDFPRLSAAQALAGIALLVCWVVYATAALRSLGALGMLLLLALFAALVWFAVERGWLELGGDHRIAWIALIVTGLILGIGMCWSSLRRALSGQADVDEVDNP
ncbi:MAG: hypothetical protein IT480_01875 [Gammaproteobacteria bacterium]|nr:hypothetical protein [Gammaproteobacteria bacterium]